MSEKKPSDELFVEWESHAYSRYLREKAQQRMQSSLNALVGVASKSSDPAVRAAWQAYADCVLFVKEFQRGS